MFPGGGGEGVGGGVEIFLEMLALEKQRALCKLKSFFSTK